MTLKPVIVELRTGKAMLRGTLAAFAALALFGVGILTMASGQMDGQTIFLGGLLTLLVAAPAVHYIGVAVRKPVALRMDKHGISGYFAEPASWPEIMQIETFSGSKGARFLGFAFLNPDIIRARQSAWSKFCNWSLNPAYRYQIVVAQDLLKDADVESLATVARAFQRDA